MDWNVMGGMMWTAMLVSSIVGLALILLLIAAIVWFVRQLGQGAASARPRGHRALDELDLRYARGEVDRGAYLSIRRDLQTSEG